MTPEGEIKKLVKAWLDEIGAYCFAPVQMGYGARTLDFLCSVRGHFVAIEVKRPGEDLTKFQKVTAHVIFSAGGVALKIATSEDVAIARRAYAALGVEGLARSLLAQS